MIHTLHGFLGLPSDWKILSDFELVAYNLWSDETEGGLSDWAKGFNTSLDKSELASRVLLGYSLGGRLALHALLDAPHLWEKAIIVSAHPGLKTQNERNNRLENDQKWADRFLKDSWEELIRDWDNQGVFARDNSRLVRSESDYKRDLLAKAFLDWSLGKQNDLSEEISQLPMPILWITGAQDKKFTDLAQGMRFKHEASKVISISEAGHRVPWEQPVLFREILRQFL